MRPEMQLISEPPSDSRVHILSPNPREPRPRCPGPDGVVAACHARKVSLRELRCFCDKRRDTALACSGSSNLSRLCRVIVT